MRRTRNSYGVVSFVTRVATIKKGHGMADMIDLL
jgi:hypothetical protein